MEVFQKSPAGMTIYDKVIDFVIQEKFSIYTTKKGEER